ncbi:MAG: rluB [Myxococcaceae bacterium]|nr:rluB [Myxococcaceae bacterium]
MASERLQKILARGGIASRRAAEQMITAGRVRVNGQIVTELGSKADPKTDKVEIDGTRVVSEDFVYLVVHKPRGVVATMSDPEGRPTVKEILGGAGGRVYPVGRLDFATSGVLLATNDGDFAEGLLHPKKAVPKTYVLKVTGEMNDENIERWRKGIRLDDGMTLPAEASLIRHEGGKTWLELTIKEGRNQQIRRMGEATGFRVMRLARTGFAGITSEGLRPGEWRPLTRDELVALKQEYGVPKKIHVAPMAVAAAQVHTKPRVWSGSGAGIGFEGGGQRSRGRTRPEKDTRQKGRSDRSDNTRGAGRSTTQRGRPAPDTVDDIPQARPAARPDTRGGRSHTRDARPDTRAARPDTRAARPDTRAARPDTRAARPSTRRTPSNNKHKEDDTKPRAERGPNTHGRRPAR